MLLRRNYVDDLTAGRENRPSFPIFDDERGAFERGVNDRCDTDEGFALFDDEWDMYGERLYGNEEMDFSLEDDVFTDGEEDRRSVIEFDISPETQGNYRAPRDVMSPNMVN